MDFNERFPERFYLNLGHRDDRRAETERILYEAGITAERFPAIDARWLKSERGFETKGRYACSLTHRLAIREAKKRRASAVLIFEDDVILEQNFLSRFQEIDLPEDWDILFLGCTQVERPTAISPGLVRVNANHDNHCYAVRASAYDRVLTALAPPKRKDDHLKVAKDRLLSDLCRSLNAYACFPNLAWQSVVKSDLLGVTYSNYQPDGTSIHEAEVTSGVAIEMFGKTAWRRPHNRDIEEESSLETPSPNPAFLFLTKEDHQFVTSWDRYFKDARIRPPIFAHTKDLGSLTQEFLLHHQIPNQIPTEWGTISLVRATLLLLEEAFKDQTISHFILLSDCCIPTKPYQSLVEFLQVDSRSWIHHQTASEVAKQDRYKASRFNSLSTIPPSNRFFQSQWMMLERKAVEIILKNDISDIFENIFAPDELYFITVLSMSGYPLKQIINERITWLKWTAGAPHPNTYECTGLSHWSEALRSPGFFARKFSSTVAVDGDEKSASELLKTI